jgi:hypothetical protein
MLWNDGLRPTLLNCSSGPQIIWLFSGMDTENIKAIDLIDSQHLAQLIINRTDNILIIDSRSFLEYNTSHISYAVNVNCSKIVKRRLQQNKISVH